MTTNKKMGCDWKICLHIGKQTNSSADDKKKIKIPAKLNCRQVN
jgi:hypothetical protein